MQLLDVQITPALDLAIKEAVTPKAAVPLSWGIVAVDYMT